MGELSDTERAVLGDVTAEQAQALVHGWVARRLGSEVEAQELRSGRIDAVWGLRLHDGRRVVVKAHRAPVNLEHVRVAREAQRLLADGGFPAPGPEVVEGRVLTAETMVSGEPADGFDPAVRRLLAEGLVRQVEVLGAHPQLRSRVGPGPSWCRYQGGPWPPSHDTLVDLRTTPAGGQWLDDHAARCAAQVLEHREGYPVVVSHGDWYAGNALVTDGVLTGVVDWELVADTEAVLAGFAAASCGASATGGGGLSTPEEVAAFLRLVESARGRELTDVEWTTAAGAAAWILAFDARWQLGLPEELATPETVELVRERQTDYLRLSR